MTNSLDIQQAQPGSSPSVADITRSMRMALGASLGREISRVEFGELLVHGLFNSGITRMTVHNWESGKYEPGLDFLLSIYTYTFFNRTDWRFHWARECMRAMKPETFDSGVIELAAEPSGSAVLASPE